MELEDVEDWCLLTSRPEFSKLIVNLLVYNAFDFVTNASDSIAKGVAASSHRFLSLSLFLSLLLVCLSLGQSLGLRHKTIALEDKEFTRVTDIDKLHTVSSEAFLHSIKLDWALIPSFSVENEIAATKAVEDVLLINECAEVLIIFTSLR